MSDWKKYRVNYGNGQVSDTIILLAAAEKHIADMDMYKAYAFIQWYDYESGEWFNVKRKDNQR